MRIDIQAGFRKGFHAQKFNKLLVEQITILNFAVLYTRKTIPAPTDTLQHSRLPSALPHSPVPSMLLNYTHFG